MCWKIYSTESRETEMIETKYKNNIGGPIPPMNHSFLS